MRFCVFQDTTAAASTSDGQRAEKRRNLQSEIDENQPAAKKSKTRQNQLKETDNEDNLDAAKADQSLILKDFEAAIARRIAVINRRDSMTRRMKSEVNSMKITQRQMIKILKMDKELKKIEEEKAELELRRELIQLERREWAQECEAKIEKIMSLGVDRRALKVLRRFEKTKKRVEEAQKAYNAVDEVTKLWGFFGKYF